MRREFIHFKGRDTYETREIKSLCPLNMNVSAVYYDDDDGTLLRSPALALAVYDTVSKSFGSHEELERERGGVGFIHSVEGGEEFADVDCSNFLGFEYGKEREDWSEGIKAYKEKCVQDEKIGRIRSIHYNVKSSTTRQWLDESRGCLENGVLTIQSKRQHVLDALAHERCMTEIKKAALETTGKEVTVNLELWEVKKP